MSLYLRAYCAAFCADVTDALRCCSCDENRIRTSKGSAILWIVSLWIVSLWMVVYALRDHEDAAFVLVCS